MYQALEKPYNKVSKGPGGVIGITKNKAAVAKWNIIKHEKMLVTQYLRDLCGLVNDDETIDLLYYLDTELLKTN